MARFERNTPKNFGGSYTPQDAEAGVRPKKFILKEKISDMMKYGICVRQAEIIKEQAYVLEQFGAQVREEEALAARNRLQELGCLDD